MKHNANTYRTLTTQYALGIGAVLLAATCLGCAWGKSPSWKFAKKLDVRESVGLKSKESTEPQFPKRLVATWTDTVLNKAGQEPVRGFGGRIAFFNQEEETPVRVEGQLVVYAYDETNRKNYETHPTRRYVFPTEQFAKHESENKLGATYSVWIPWDEAGGEQKKISLIARFEPVGGPRVIGEQTRHLLPGTMIAENNQYQQPQSHIEEVQLASHTEIPGKVDPANAKPLEKTATRSEATTIQLSKSWQERLNAHQAK